MARIVGIGANVFDTLFRLGRFPAEDSKQQALAVAERGGGPCGTALAAAARLGADCAYVGNCSDDGAGRFLRSDFEKYGVDVSLMRAVPDTSAFRSCIWLCDETATRTCVFHRGSVPPTRLGDGDRRAIAAADVLLVDGNDLEAAVDGARTARENGTAVLYDAGGLYDGAERLLALTDILIPSEEFALRHTGAPTAADAAKALYRKYVPKVVVVTQGKNGGVFFDGSAVRRFSAFPVEAVDTNGAGDVFHGAFAFALTKGFPYERCCVFAAAVSAIKCTGLGARESVPSYDRTISFLRERCAEW